MFYYLNQKLKMANYVVSNTGGNIKLRLGASSMNTCLHTNVIPAFSAPTNLSEIIGDKILEVDIRTSGASGTVGVQSGYSGPTGQTSFDIQYINLTHLGSNVVVRASATYPNYVAGWYNGNNGTGTQLVAGGSSYSTLDITFSTAANTIALQTIVYAHFGAPSVSWTAVDLGYGSSETAACSDYLSSPDTYYTNGSNANDWRTDDDLATNSDGSTAAPSGYYSDGTSVAYWNGSAFSGDALCTI